MVRPGARSPSICTAIRPAPEHRSSRRAVPSPATARTRRPGRPRSATRRPQPAPTHWVASYTPDSSGNTNGKSGACADSNETSVVVDARISITPNATNEVGQPHTFTVTLEKDTGTGVFVAGGRRARRRHADELERRRLTLDADRHLRRRRREHERGRPVHDHLHLADGGQGHGPRVGDAVDRRRRPFTVQTDGTGRNSGDAVKTFVDANIQITPQTATNRGRHDPHVHGARQREHRRRRGFVNAPGRHADQLHEGLSGPGALHDREPVHHRRRDRQLHDHADLGDDRRRRSSRAHTTVSVGGVALTRDTNGTGAQLRPGAARRGSTRRSRSRPTRRTRSASRTPSRSRSRRTAATARLRPGGRRARRRHADRLERRDSRRPDRHLHDAGANTDANGQCTITFTSPTTGKVTGHATSTLTVGGAAHVHACRPTAPLLNSGDAVKTFVDAKISITPDATNEVGQPHTFTVTLKKDPGTGTFVPAAGEHVDVTLTDSNGADATRRRPAPARRRREHEREPASARSCSPRRRAGKVTGHASSTLLGRPAPRRSPSRPTAPASNSVDAVKTYVDANIQITPPNATNRVGGAHVHGARGARRRPHGRAGRRLAPPASARRRSERPSR